MRVDWLRREVRLYDENAGYEAIAPEILGIPESEITYRDQADDRRVAYLPGDLSVIVSPGSAIEFHLHATSQDFRPLARVIRRLLRDRVGAIRHIHRAFSAVLVDEDARGFAAFGSTLPLQQFVGRVFSDDESPSILGLTVTTDDGDVARTVTISGAFRGSDSETESGIGSTITEAIDVRSKRQLRSLVAAKGLSQFANDVVSVGERVITWHSESQHE